MKRKLLETSIFRKKFKKLTKETKKRFESQFRILQDLSVSPYQIGKPLGFREFRELKQKGVRVYFYVYKSKIIILLLDVSNKKTQEDIIIKLKEYLRSVKFFK